MTVIQNGLDVGWQGPYAHRHDRVRWSTWLLLFCSLARRRNCPNSLWFSHTHSLRGLGSVISPSMWMCTPWMKELSKRNGCLYLLSFPLCLLGLNSCLIAFSSLIQQLACLSHSLPPARPTFSSNLFYFHPSCSLFLSPRLWTCSVGVPYNEMKALSGPLSHRHTCAGLNMGCLNGGSSWTCTYTHTQI